MGNIEKFTYEDTKGKSYFDINSIAKLIIKDKKIIFDKVIFDQMNSGISRPINIDFLTFGIKIAGKLVPNSSDVKIIEFNMCILNKVNIEVNSQIVDIKIKDSIILDRFILKNKILNQLNLEHSKFYQKVKIQECSIKTETSFFNTSFKELADFYRTKFDTVIFERTDFEKISVFSEVKFNKGVDFKYVKFLGKSIFRDTVIKEKLNLRNTIFDDDANFLDITSIERPPSSDNNDEFIGETTPIKVENRETARVIKDFYDKSNNIIEANKFYALEMQEREKELNIDKKSTFFDWLIFKMHRMASNYSTNWSQALFWIVFLSMMYTLELKGLPMLTIYATALIPILILEYIFKNKQIIYRITDYLVLIILAVLIYFFIDFRTLYSIDPMKLLTDISQNINMFSIFKGKSIGFGEFIYKVIMGYLIYQLIISVRQNTRRK